MYAVYIFPVVILGYALLALNLWVERNAPIPTSIIVNDETGRRPVPIDNILWIRRDGRHNIFKLSDRSICHSAQTLDELEGRLPRDRFFRINRSAIVNRENIKNFSFWENEKYVLRTHDGEEFTTTRGRMTRIRTHLDKP